MYQICADLNTCCTVRILLFYVHTEGPVTGINSVQANEISVLLAAITAGSLSGAGKLLPQSVNQQQKE